MTQGQKLRIETPRVFVPLLKPSRYKGAHGGRGSGKSHFFAEMVVERCVMAPTRVVCIREVQKSLEQSVKQLIEDKIRALGVEHLFRTIKPQIEGTNGSLIIFQGMQDHTAASIKSLEGFDIAWVEEAQTLSETSLTLLRPTIRKEGSELWFSWNPKRATDPVDQLLRSKTPADAIVVRANYMDNPFLPQTLRNELEEDRADEDKFNHVWLGDYELVAKGAYYGKQMSKADKEGRICNVPHEETARVWTAWDLGMNDQTCIWFAQLVGREIRIIDYYEASGEALSHYVGVIDRKGYNYGGHLLPHDVEARELGTGKSRREVLESLRLTVLTVPQHTVEDGINAVRSVLSRCWFDKTKTARGIECLQMYRAEFDDKLNTLRSRPLHDEFSHGCLVAGEKVETTRGLVNVEDVVVGDYVWTPSGISLVTHAGPVKIADRLIEVTTSKGQQLTCTPEHKILTARGFVPASSLTTSDRILTGREWNARLIGLASKGSPIGFRATITGEMPGGRKGRQTFTGRFTNVFTGLFQTATKFITGTVGHSTTTRLISGVYPQPSGIGQTLGLHGTARMAGGLGTTASGLKSVARSVISYFARLILRAPNSATRIAKLRHFECGEGGTLVFDLTVEKNACYRANGLLVSNSDAFRYLAMGLDYFAGIDLPKAKDRYRDRRDSQTTGSWMSV